MSGRSMVNGAPWKLILRFALPVLASAVLQQMYNTVDAVIMGKFSGEAALSAVGTTGSFAFIFLALAIGFSAGNGVVVAQCYGAGDHKMVRANASAGILLMLGMGVLASFIGILVSRPAFTHLVAVDDSFLELTITYFRVYTIGLLFQFGYNIFSSILRAVGDSAASLYFLLISSVINIVLDLLFVAVFRWGVVGAALATDIAQLGSFAASYIYMRKKYPLLRFERGEYVWDRRLARQTLATGFPITLQQLTAAVGLTLLQRAVNGFHQAMTASFTVGYRVELYLSLPCTSFQTTLATFAGQNIGAGRMDRVRQGVRQSVLMALGMALCIAVVMRIFTDEFIGLFNLGEQATIYCRDHIRAVSLISIIMATYFPLYGVFQASNHGVAATIAALGSMGMRVLSTYVLRYSPFLGHTIIWWNGLFGFGLGFLISWSYYISGRWQKDARIKLSTDSIEEKAASD